MQFSWMPTDVYGPRHGNSLSYDALVPPGSVVAHFHNAADWLKMKVSSGPG